MNNRRRVAVVDALENLLNAFTRLVLAVKLARDNIFEELAARYAVFFIRFQGC